MSDPARVITVEDLRSLAKRLRLRAYYDVGTSLCGDGEDDDRLREAAVRQGRASALAEVADVIDEVTDLDSTLTQADLESWRR